MVLDCYVSGVLMEFKFISDNFFKINHSVNLINDSMYNLNHTSDNIDAYLDLYTKYYKNIRSY
jgi:hypothetical protein